jgi:hypothetical protein
LFWVLVIILLLGFLTVAACGGLILLLAQPHWQTHESLAGGFKVDFPAELQPDIRDMAKGKRQDNGEIEGTMLVGRLEVYSVYHKELDAAARQFSDEQILKTVVAGMKADPENQGIGIIREQPMTVAGYPAREVVFTHPDGGTNVCRVVVAGSHQYILGVSGPLMKPDGNERSERFFDSFQVTAQPVVPPRPGERKGVRPRAKPRVQEDADE